MLWNLNWSWLKIRLLRKSRLLLSGGRTRLDRVTHWPEDYHTRSVCGRSRRRGHFVQTQLPCIEGRDAAGPRGRFATCPITPLGEVATAGADVDRRSWQSKRICPDVRYQRCQPD